MPPFSSDIHHVRQSDQAEACGYLKKAGYASGGAVKRADGGSVDDSDSDSDTPLRPGETYSAANGQGLSSLGPTAKDGRLRAGEVKTTDRGYQKAREAEGRKFGGKVEGETSPMRLDKRARGGRMDKGGGKGPQVNVVVHSSNPQERQIAAQQGMQAGMQKGAAMAKMAGGPPGAPPGMPPGGPPPGMMGPGGPPPPGPAGAGPAPPGVPPRPPGMMRRGGKIDAGAGSGLGRIEKAYATGGPVEGVGAADDELDTHDVSQGGYKGYEGAPIRVKEHLRKPRAVS